MKSWRQSIHPALSSATDGELLAYLVGASRDACFNRHHRTTRFAQKDRRWLEVLAFALDQLGYRSWTYREGSRDVYVLETSWAAPPFVFRKARHATAYVRGYFDAEGGIPQSPSARFYIQLVQKNKRDLDDLRLICSDLGLSCGRIHNPSVKVDPDYWRFYIGARSHLDFVRTINSWHPRKRSIFDARFPYVGLPS